MKSGRATPLRISDLRRLEAAVVQLQACVDLIVRQHALLLREHADLVDRLSQRMQVVLTEAELLRGALEEARGNGQDRQRRRSK